MADITCCAANSLHGVAVILGGMASILSDVPDILQSFLVFWGFQREKYTFFQVLKNWPNKTKSLLDTRCNISKPDIAKPDIA